MSEENKIKSETMKRYFLVTVVFNAVFKNITSITDGVYINRHTIDEICYDTYNNTPDAIINIFEFKSRFDYENFIKE